MSAFGNKSEKSIVSYSGSKIETKDYIMIGLFAALMAVCSWISVPAAVPFTLQTFGVFLAVGLLGGKRGTIAICVYLLLGAIGIPVFSGFTGGLGHILGMTGGYIAGFVFSALLMWALEKLLGSSYKVLVISMVLGLIVCYAFGTAWFMIVYMRTSGPIGVGAALSMCVIPYIIPDLIKISLASIMCMRLRPLVRNSNSVDTVQ